jgi:hypothetical protein
LQDQLFKQQRSLQDQQIEGQMRLSDRDFQQKRSLTAQDYQMKGALSDQDYRQTRAITELDTGSKEKIASWNVAAHDKEKAMSALAAMEGNYAEVFRTIAANNQLPSDARNIYLEHIGKLRDSSLRLVEQMYGVDLSWDSPNKTNVSV